MSKNYRVQIKAADGDTDVSYTSAQGVKEYLTGSKVNPKALARVTLDGKVLTPDELGALVLQEEYGPGTITHVVDAFLVGSEGAYTFEVNGEEELKTVLQEVETLLSEFGRAAYVRVLRVEHVVEEGDPEGPILSPLRLDIVAGEGDPRVTKLGGRLFTMVDDAVAALNEAVPGLGAVRKPVGDDWEWGDSVYIGFEEHPGTLARVTPVAG